MSAILFVIVCIAIGALAQRIGVVDWAIQKIKDLIGV